MNLNNKTKKPGATVHFSPSSPAIIPPRESLEEPEEEEEEEDEDDAPQTNGHVKTTEETATALYDFEADGEDELSVAQGELLVVLEKDGDEWWKCRNTKGLIGVVPASYLEVSESVESICIRRVCSTGFVLDGVSRYRCARSTSSQSRCA